MTIYYRYQIKMPRNYKRVPLSRVYAKYNGEVLEATVRRIKARQLTVTAAAKQTGISYGTLWNASQDQHRGATGGQTRLSAESELAIVDAIGTMTKWKMPLTSFDIKCMVKGYLDRKGILDARFKNNLPGQDWLNSFSMRHKLVNRCADNVKPVRAEISSEDISTYFRNLEETLEGVLSRNIFNYDETNFTDDPGVSKIVCRGGSGRVEKKVQHSKSSVSVMFCGSASGTFVPPMVVYRAKNVYTE